MDGKSVGIKLPKLPIWAFIALVPDMITSSRLSGSASCVARSITVPETWLLLLVSPSLRKEIGTAATRVLSGSSRDSLRYSLRSTIWCCGCAALPCANT